MHTTMLIRKTKKSTIIIKIALYIVVLSTFGFLIFNLSNESADETNKQSIIQEQINAKSTESAILAIKRRPVYITLPGAEPIRAIVEDYTLDNNIWTIISKTNPFPVDYVPAELKIPDVYTRTDKSDIERSVRSDIEQPLIDMFNAAENDGYNLMIGSGYRSAALQKVYFDNLANSIGEDAANQSIAYPGQSEHQTGLAVDISAVSRQCYLDNCFAATSDGQWLANNSYKYGFTLRYPSGKESITGYRYESWHFRYVGVDLATALYQSGLTLDEAWPYLVKADNELKQNGAI